MSRDPSVSTPAFKQMINDSKRRGDARSVHIWSPVSKPEAWPNSLEMDCPDCGMRVDLCNPAIQKDGRCACGCQLILG